MTIKIKIIFITIFFLRSTVLLALQQDGDLIKLIRDKTSVKVIRAYLTADSSEVNVMDESGVAPIHHAVNLGQIEVIRLLIGHGANIDLADKNGETALMMAIAQYREKIAELLIQYKANLELVSVYNWNAIAYAIRANWPEMVQFLLENGSNPNPVVDTASNPLWLAAAFGKHRIVRILLQFGATDNNGQILFAAEWNGYPEVVELLKVAKFGSYSLVSNFTAS